MPLGSTKAIPVDIAVIGATHRNLREMIDRQEFREDLYYRLNGLALRLPALRDRSDLLAVARRILQAERPQDTPVLSATVVDMFTRYRWPGNIRQLANVLRTAAVMSASEHEITTAHLSDDFLEDAAREADAPPASAVLRTAEPAQVVPFEKPVAVESPTGAADPRSSLGTDAATRIGRWAPGPSEPPHHTLEEAEIDMIRRALSAAGGNISAASKQLGISRNTIYRKLRWNKAGE